MGSEVEMIIIRSAVASRNIAICDSFRSKFHDGVSINIDKIHKMVGHQPKNKHDLLQASNTIVRSFLKDGYKPILLAGVFNVDDILFYKKSISERIISFSLFDIEESLLNLYLQQKKRDSYTYINTKDVLTSYKKRKKYLQPQDLLKINNQIFETRFETDYFINTSTLNQITIVENLMKIISKY